nr:hypothetical protein [uncultured bacterium]BAH90355.1 hypothetical protein [uncultured bacterium]BAH90471.1 hypothetical protein [uncultured bacterium]
MASRNYKDIAGGSLLVVFGLMFSWYAISHYKLGSLSEMGSGFFPTSLGLILAAFGAVIFISGLFKQSQLPDIGWRSPIFVIAGVAAFASIIGFFGLIPAVLGLTVISASADQKVQPAKVVLLGFGLSVIAWLVFGEGLGLSVPMFRWPL